MNTPSPLIPQGATPPRGNSSFYFKFLMIVAVHVVVIGGMLVQGCKDTSNTANRDNNPSPDAPVLGAAPASNATVDVPPFAPTAPSNTAAIPSVTPGPAAPLVPPMAAEGFKPVVDTALSPSGEKDYVIVAGDRLAAIAHKNGVTLKALMDANPGINPTKLHIKQTIHIPASIAVAATTSGTGAAPASGVDAAAAESAVYTVKPGDILLRIAKSHGTTVKKIMALNDLRTTSIHANQKLKLPVAAAAPSTPVAAPAAVTASTTTAPVTRVSATTTPVAAN